MPQTPRRSTVPHRVAAFDGAAPRGGPSRLPGLLLATVLLVAPVLAGAQGTPAASPAAGDATSVAPTRLPRSASGKSSGHPDSGQTGHRTAQQRFEEANTSHDGHLTEAQAQAAHLRGVATHFAEIDSHHRGYITFDEIHSWRAERRAERKAAREKAAK